MYKSRRSRITQKNVEDLLPILFEVAADWILFMGQLGFPKERISQIERDTCGRCVECLRTALHEWAVTEIATYDRIIATLRGGIFHNEQLAQKVEKYVASDSTNKGVAIF